MLNIVHASVKFLRNSHEVKYRGGGDPAVLDEQRRLLHLMDIWKIRFEGLMQKEQINKSVNFKGLHILSASHITFRLWLEMCLCPSETAWDQYKSQFEEMIRLAEILIYDSSRFPDKGSKSFSFEMLALPTLQSVAWKCRFPALRRKALLLLRASPLRECLFDTQYSFALYERVINLEESVLNLPPGEVPADDQLPPEAARIHQIDLPPLPSTPMGRPVNFLTRPFGLDKGWSVRSEYILINDAELLPCYDIRGSDASNWETASSQSHRAKTRN
jgi:hypothetical protein